jgi:4-amino-4-deoxy-L-arabinose transferase-like glycosyltransferase
VGQPVTIADLGGAMLGPIDRLAAALVDPDRRERTAVQLLIAYVAVWTLYGVLAKGSQDVHFDLGEAVAWSREPAFGYSKHPPLSAWIVKAWFTSFPLADWAYYLLAMALAGLALWIAWMLSARWLDAEKGAAGLALLTLVPFYNFHALKFNANTVLMPLWAATTLWFLRSFERRDPLCAALAGAAAAAAMLGKYWSIVLLAGLAIAAVGDPRRGAYFRSPAPWITVAAGSIALAPHVAWLLAHGASPFDYALDKHQAASFLDATVGSLKFLAGGAAYLGAPIVLAAAATLPNAAAIRDTLWPASAHRRIAALAFWAPLAVAILAGLAAQVLITSLWLMSAVTLVPVVLLSSPLLGMRRGALPMLLGVAIALPVLVTLAAPAIAYVIHRNGVGHHATHYRLVAEAVDRAWRAATPQAMGLVGSDTNLGNGVAFYLADRPSMLDVLDPRQTPWADEARIARQGIALVCAIEDTGCVKAVDALASRLARGKRIEVEIVRSYLGVAGKPERYSIITVPPQSQQR